MYLPFFPVILLYLLHVMYNYFIMDVKFSFISETKDGVILFVKLVPNSSYSKIVDYNEEYVRIKISSPPIEGKANSELISFCSKIFDVNKSKLQIISGEKSKLKKILIKDTNLDFITQKLIFMLDSVNKDK